MGVVLEAIENLIMKYWPWLLGSLFLYLIWQFNLSRELLSFVGVLMLGRIAWKMWVHYVQQDFISGIDFVLLEIIPPRDVERSPKAMELFFTNALYHFSNKGGKEEFWQGAVWFWFSLELVSLEGQVHFYVRTPTRVRSLIETQMYAQYPQAQVKAVEDYTLAVDAITPESAWNGWGCEFELLKHQAYPIRTYIDYELDTDPKEEYKIDPISPVIEFFGSLQKGEQAWMQIVITVPKKQYHNKGFWLAPGGFLERHDWVAESRIQLFRILEPYINTREQVTGGFGIEYRTPKFMDPTIKRISEKTGKLGFETGVRIMYVAKKEAFNMSNRRNIRLIFRQYQNPDANGFNRINSTQADAFSSQFFSLSPKKVMILADRMLHEYRERAFFHLPMRHHLISEHSIPWPFTVLVKQFFLPYFHHQTYVLNVEELATIWHFPGQILKVPTLERIESKEASPPTNLPI